MSDGSVRCEIFDESGTRFIRHEERVPVCGEDFCDSCGDCLYCYWNGYCPDGHHRWVIYGPDPLP